MIVNFDPSTPSTGPFPTDYLTTGNPNQKTGLSVNMPIPAECAMQPQDTECGLIPAINLLDGFNLQPRITVNFSGAIDPTTLQTGIVVVWLFNVTNDEVGLGPDGKITTINQVVYDPTTNTAYAKPNDFFDQHRHYAIVVTDAVQDTLGNPVQVDPRFTSCITSSSPTYYCSILQEVMGVLNPAALPGNIVAVSAFTTMSATAWMESARDLLPQVPVGFQSAGASVPTAGITALNLEAQVGDNPTTFQSIPLQIPASASLAGIDRIVFGTYQSPNFLNAGQNIPFIPTATAPVVPTAQTISFHAYIPSSAMPTNGYPVIIYGHGFEDNSYTGSPTLIASNFAQAGFVTLAINAVGHGYGPQSTIQLMQQSNVVAAFPSGGRGLDVNADGTIGDAEGCFLSWPVPAGLADCIEQTAIDLMQLEALVTSGTSIEPSTGLMLDPTKIYYSGNSLGAMYGTLVTALDPNVPAAALDVGGGSPLDIERWSPVYNSYAQELVAGYTPSLLNAGSGYNENYVLRNQLVDVNTVPGAIAIQNLFEELNWLQGAGDPLSYAMHLNLTPLPNIPAKSALFTYDLGDQSVPNPMQSALIRDAGTFNNSTLYRTDLAGPVAVQLCCQLPADSHGFLTDYENGATSVIAQAAQQELAGFLASGGATIPNANVALQALLPFTLTATVFQTPGLDLETLNFGDTAPVSPNFSVGVNPLSQTFLPGGSTTYTATISALNGFTGTVSLTASGLPSGATPVFNPTSIIGSGNSTLTISSSSSTPPGTYPLSIVGTSGSLTQTGSATLIVQAPPVQVTAVSVSPPTGSGQSQTFAATYSDTNGASAIATAYILIGSSTAAAGGCWVQFNASSNTYNLMNDAGTTFSAPVSVGSGTVSNSQCTFSGSGAGATPSGNNLTVNFPITFPAGYAGAQNVYLNVVDGNGLSSGWQQIGSFTVTGEDSGATSANPVPTCNPQGYPCVVSLTPITGSGLTGTFTGVFNHAGGASQHYLGYILFLPTPNIVDYTATGSCLVEYNRIDNAMRLVNNAGTNWLPGVLGIPLTQGGTLTNNFCTLNITKSSAVISGTTMTVKVAMTFNSSFSGVLATFMQAFDVTGAFTGMTQFGNWVVDAGTRKPGPYVVGMSPTSGSGLSATLSFTTGDTKGVGDLAFVTMLIAPDIVGSLPCQAFYFPYSNTINLVDDSSTAMVSTSGIVPGSAGTLSNSRCSINTGTASSSQGVDTVTVTLPMTFDPSTFGGAKNIYLNAFDDFGNLSHWVTSGTWTVQ